LDLFSLEFLSALGAIVVIDLVLAGDNAIVIVPQCNVPRHLQRRASWREPPVRWWFGRR
jgi:predicted tellurium resistance membrane protein TerC